jgi:hypothetical protein
MNYATALALPSLTAEIQGYGQTVIRYTPIIFKAFSKTIAPQLLTTFKDLSHYYLQCGQGAGAWAMTAVGITHNPIQAAVRSAVSELTSAEAQATYRRIGYIVRETAMDVLVVALCGVVAVAQGIEVAQKVYRLSKRCYSWVQKRINLAPAIAPSVGKTFAVTNEKAIAAIVEEVRFERYFLKQFDQLDLDILAITIEEVDEAIAQATIAQLKSARAALVLQTEGDRLAREALAFMVDHTVTFAMVEPKPVAEVAVVDALAASLEVLGAITRPKRQRKTSTGKAAEAKPMQTKARAKTGAK